MGYCELAQEEAKKGRPAEQDLNMVMQAAVGLDDAVDRGIRRRAVRDIQCDPAAAQRGQGLADRGGAGWPATR